MTKTIDEKVKNLTKRVVDLENVVFGKKALTTEKNKSKTTKKLEIPKFDMNIRAFAKNHVRGLSGSKKFTLFVAYITKGAVDAETTYTEVKRIWDETATLHGTKLGGGINATRAKEYGWIDCNNQGKYHLMANWLDIFK